MCGRFLLFAIPSCISFHYSFASDVENAVQFIKKNIHCSFPPICQKIISKICVSYVLFHCEVYLLIFCQEIFYLLFFCPSIKTSSKYLFLLASFQPDIEFQYVGKHILSLSQFSHMDALLRERPTEETPSFLCGSKACISL